MWVPRYRNWRAGCSSCVPTGDQEFRRIRYLPCFGRIGESQPARSAGFTFFTKPLKLYLDGSNRPTNEMSDVGLIAVSSPAAQRQALIDMRRKPSLRRSSDAPWVVVKTRPDLPEAAVYV